MNLMYLRVISKLYDISYYVYFYYAYVVPAPTVNVLEPSSQTVGQPLTLQCEVTTVMGITGRVEIVWNSEGAELRRVNVTSSTMDGSLVYTDSYSISLLRTSDNGRVIECEVVINTSPPITATDSITLNVDGE